MLADLYNSYVTACNEASVEPFLYSEWLTLIHTPNKRLYHIVAINEKTGRKVYMTGYPMTHHGCCVMKSKITEYPWRRIQLEEVV
jgi:hypothetical protein